MPTPWPITFRSPTPAGLTYVGRNHPLVEGLAEHLMDLAFHPTGGDQPVARCGVIRTPQVDPADCAVLLRLALSARSDGDGGTASLAEETLAWGLRGVHPDVSELEPAEAQRLLDGQLDAVSVPPAERQEVLRETLGWWPDLQFPLAKMLSARAARLAEEHGRLADLVGSGAKLIQIEPHSPPDLLGLVVLLPVVPMGWADDASHHPHRGRAAVARLPGDHPRPAGPEAGRFRAGCSPLPRGRGHCGLERCARLLGSVRAPAARAKDGESLTSATREAWIIPLLEALGYRLTFQRRAAEVDGRTYAISHRAATMRRGRPSTSSPSTRNWASAHRPAAGRFHPTPWCRTT